MKKKTGFAVLATGLLSFTSISTFAALAAAQQPPPQEPVPPPQGPGAPAPSDTTPKPAPSGDAGAPPPATPEAGAPATPGAPPAVPASPALPEPNAEPGEPDKTQQHTGLLAPVFPENFYPAQPPQDGLLTGIPIDEKYGLRFAMHGYFRAPMRITKAARPEGSTKPGEGDYNWRTPYLIDDDYFRSGFAYTHINEQDWTELYFSVGNKHLTATFQLQGSLYSDAARPIIDRQLGVAQGWLTYRTDLDFIPFFKTHLRVKGGAFWDRFGHLPQYDTYIFARIHQTGEQVRLEFERDKTTIWLAHGLGVHQEDIASNQGLTLLNYATAGISYDRTIEVGGYFFDSTSRDKKPLKELTDAELSVVGADVRADTHVAGKAYAATSYVSADKATYTAPAIEVMHAYGGRGITESYLGTQSSDNGTGSLWNVGFQYDFSVADAYKSWTGSKASPLPWRGDVTASLFGLYSFVQSKQASPDPLVNKDDRKMFKWGAEGAYRITEWMAAVLRYDRVILDVGDSANSFRILSPKLAFFTSFLTREILYVQYSRYMYNERIRLRPGQVQLENMPDDHVFKVQAQMTW